MEIVRRDVMIGRSAPFHNRSGFVNEVELSESISHSSRQSRSPGKIRAWATIYFAGQAFLGAVWWMGLGTIPGFANLFFPKVSVSFDLWTFLFADLFWFVAASAVVSAATGRGWPLASAARWCLVGAVGYAWFCCLGMLINGGSWYSAVLMAGSWLGTFFFAIKLDRSGFDPPDPDGGVGEN